MMFVARIDERTVTQVTVGDDAGWCATVFGGVWIATEQHVGIGWTYSEQDGFRPPRPFPSWTWDGERWVPPVPQPDEGWWEWDENTQTWIEHEDEEI